jgi:hypothetical protein
VTARRTAALLPPAEKHLAVVVGEDWYPNINGSLVRAVLCNLRDGQWRVAAWGGDDFGLERDCATEQEARDLYDRMPDPLSQQWCLQRGFVRA